MRRKDREVIAVTEIDGMIREAKVLHLALKDEEYPYLVPLHFGYEWKEGKLIFYMHCAKEGYKLDLIRRDGRACMELEGPVEPVSGGEIPCRYGAAFSSVIARGSVEILAEDAEKIHGLQVLMHHQTGRNFAMDKEMADTVEVLRFTAESFTAKARVIPE